MRILPLLIFVSLAITLPSHACAQIINEVSPLSTPDWVEIFLAPDASELSIDGMTLVDSVGNTKKLEGTLTPGTYLVVEWSNKLNNKGDTVFLVKEGVKIDVWDYSGCLPEGNETLGKQNGKIVRLKVASKGATNASEYISCSAQPTSPPTTLAPQTPSPTPKPAETLVSHTLRPKATSKPQSIVLSATAAATSSSTSSPIPQPVQSTSPFLFLIPVGMGITAYGVKELVKSVKSHI